MIAKLWPSALLYETLNLISKATEASLFFSILLDPVDKQVTYYCFLSSDASLEGDERKTWILMTFQDSTLLSQ